MKKMLAILCVMGVCGGSAIAATASNTTYTESWVNKLTAPLAQKEKELQAKQTEAQKAQAQRQKELAAKQAEIEKAQKQREKELAAKKAEYEKAQKEREKELAKKKAEYEKAQKEREAAAVAKKQQVNNDVNNLKKSLDAFKKYGK